MALQQSMKRFTRSINSKYIYGRVVGFALFLSLLYLRIRSRTWRWLLSTPPQPPTLLLLGDPLPPIA